MLHDYPPVSGGGLALAVRDLTASVPGLRCAVLSSRLVDHYADDRYTLAGIDCYASIRSVLAAARHADTILVHWTFSFRRLSTLAVLAAPLSRSRVICVFHTGPDHCRFNRLRRLPAPVRRVLLDAFASRLAYCDATIALSRGHAAALARESIPATHVLPLPVAHLPGYDLAYRRHQRQASVPARIGIAGELSALKGSDAVPRLLCDMTPEVGFRVAGDGPLRPLLERTVGELTPVQRQAVSLDGRLKPEQMPAFYGSVDCLLVTSWTEAQCRVVVEAMLAGVLVLARPIDGLGDLIHDGLTGCFVDPVDPGSLANALRWLASDQTATRAMRAQARERAARANARATACWTKLLHEGSDAGVTVPW